MRRVMRVAAFLGALVALVLCGCQTPTAIAPTATMPARPDVHVWALDLTGSVAMTSNGGGTWTTRNVGGASPNTVYTALTFPDRHHGWIVGSSGSIVATTDGGASWHAQASSTSALLRDVDFADALHGCAVGVGTILTTVDGGRTWVPRLTRQSVYFRGIVCIDATHLVAVGDGGPGGAGVFYRSDDGGRHWRAAYRSSEAAFYGIAAPDAQHCWILGEESETRTGVILASKDNGVHWTTQYARAFGMGAVSPFFTSVAFADASHGWVVGLNHTILATTDGGASWSKQSDGSQGRNRTVACVSARDAWLVGFQELSGVVGSTSDGGSTWALLFEHHGDAFVDVACLVAK
jgi:photosystem II stability/assembly factor-like uncharacterized protein